MPQLDSASFLSQIIWLIISFASLYFLLSRFALPKIGHVINLRDETIDKDLAQAEYLRKQASDIEHQYNAVLKDAKANAAVIIAETNSKIKQEADLQLQELDKTLAVQLGQAEDKINSLKGELEKKLEIMCIDVVSQVVEKLIDIKPDVTLIRSSINNIK